jgi:hypothetical protein
MTPPRRLAMRSREQLQRLTEERLLAYRKKALSLENSPEESDYAADELASLDDQYIWFKSDPRWSPQYSVILEVLAFSQSSGQVKRSS